MFAGANGRPVGRSASPRFTRGAGVIAIIARKDRFNSRAPLYYLSTLSLGARARRRRRRVTLLRDSER